MVHANLVYNFGVQPCRYSLTVVCFFVPLLLGVFLFSSHQQQFTLSWQFTHIYLPWDFILLSTSFCLGGGRGGRVLGLPDECLCLYKGIHDAPSVVHSLNRVRLFATPWTAACQVSLSFTISQSLHKLLSIESVIPSNHLILCHPLLLLPSIFPSIRGFFNELALHVKWPKYWSFSFSIISSNKYSWGIFKLKRKPSFGVWKGPYVMSTFLGIFVYILYIFFFVLSLIRSLYQIHEKFTECILRWHLEGFCWIKNFIWNFYFFWQ